MCRIGENRQNIVPSSFLQLQVDKRSPVNRPTEPKFAKVPSPTRAESLRRSPEPAASQPDPARTVPSQVEPARSTPSPSEAARSTPSGGETARSASAGHDPPVRRDSVPPRRPPPPAPVTQRLARAQSQAAPTRPHEPPLVSNSYHNYCYHHHIFIHVHRVLATLTRSSLQYGRLLRIGRSILRVLNSDKKLRLRSHLPSVATKVTSPKLFIDKSWFINYCDTSPFLLIDIFRFLIAFNRNQKLQMNEIHF